MPAERGSEAKGAEHRPEELAARLRDLKTRNRELARSLALAQVQLAFYRSYHALIQGVIAQALAMALQTRGEGGGLLGPVPGAPLAQTVGTDVYSALPIGRAGDGAPEARPGEAHVEPQAVALEQRLAEIRHQLSGLQVAPGNTLDAPALAPDPAANAPERSAVDDVSGRGLEVLRLMTQGLSGEGIVGRPSSIRPITPPPTPKSLRALLVGSNGRTYELGPSEASLGRCDQRNKIFPQIDLTAENPKQTVHRRHARIFFREGRWYLKEEPGVRNGTFVNGQRLKPEEPVSLNDGDRIQLSRVHPVELVFRIPR